MKLIFLILLSIFLFTACSEESGDSTNGQEDPYFELEVIDNNGFESETDPVTPTFYIRPESVTGDKPRKFVCNFGDGSEDQEIDGYNITHPYPAQGVYNVTITLTDNDDEEYIQEATVRVKSQVDISVQSINTQYITFDPGAEGTISVSIANLGTKKGERPFNVKAYLSPDQTLTDESIEIGFVEIETLDIGEISTQQLDYTIPNDAEPGLYWLIVKGDDNAQYVEINEANNISLFSTQVEILGGTSRSPDLTVSDITLPAYFIKDDPFYVGMDIINQGETTSPPFSYKIILSEDQYVDEEDTEDPNDIILKYDYISSSLASQEHLQTIKDVVINSLGEYYLLIVLDPTNDIKEADETNNIFISDKITVGTTLEGIDLLPYNITLSPSIPINQGRTLTINYSVKNRGDRPAIGGNIRFFISSDQMLDEEDYLIEVVNEEDLNLPTIGGGLFVDKILNVTIPEDLEIGEYHILVDVNHEVDDETRPIEEVDYSNNFAYSRSFEVIEAQICARDIAVENIRILPNPAFEGSPYTLQFSFSNSGMQMVNSFIAKLYAAPAGEELIDDADSNLVKIYNVPILAAESSIPKEIVAHLPNPLLETSYCIMFHLDTTAIIGECDEENNMVTYCFDVTTRGDDNDIVVSNVHTETTVLRPGENVVVSFDVENIGQESIDPPSNTATFYCRAYFSPDENFDSRDYSVELRKIVYNVVEGETINVDDYTFTVPEGLGNRQHKLFIKCDDEGVVPEHSEENNVASMDEWIEIKNDTLGCDADLYERNEDYSSASTIEPGVISGILCDQDEDWYYLGNLTTTHKLRIEMEQRSGSNNDTDLILYKLGETELEEVVVSDTTEDELIELNIISEENIGEYYLRVFPKSESSFTSMVYDLKYSYEEVGGPGIDLLLRDASIDRQVLMTGEPFNINYSVENLKDDDSGAYSVSVYISDDRNLDNTDLFVNIIPGESLSLLQFENFTEELTFNEDLEAGLYYIYIVLDYENSIEETDENNNIFMQQVVINRTSTCQWDDLEPNSANPIEAKVISNGFYEELFVCSDDMDLYLVYLVPGTPFTASVEFNDDEHGNIDLYLYKPGGDPSSTSTYSNDDIVAESDDYGDIESFTYNPVQAGFHYLKVYKSSYGGIDDQPYIMNLSGIVDGYNLITDSVNIEQEYLEANEDFNVTYSFHSISTRDVVTPFNFNFYLSEDPVLSEEDRLIHQDQYTYFALDETFETTTRITLPGDIATASYYIIGKVDGDDQITELNENDNTSRERVSISGICAADYFEYNNTIESAEENATPNKNHLYNSLTLCSGDIDYYAVYLNSGDHVFVRLYFNNSQGDMDLRLYDRDGTTIVGNSNSNSDDEEISFNVENSGIYYIRVKFAPGITGSNTYDMEILIPSCDNVVCENGTCELDEEGFPLCNCDDGYIRDENDRLLCHDDPCDPNPCGDYALCDVTMDYNYECICNEDAHEDPNSGICIPDTRDTVCSNLNDIPQNGEWDLTNPDGNFTQQWDENTQSWIPEDNYQCLWSCSIGYTGDQCLDCSIGYHDDGDGVCVSNLRDKQCDNYEEIPENGQWDQTNPNGYFQQNYNQDTQLWEPDSFVCQWSCQPGYIGETCSSCDTENGYELDADGICSIELLSNGGFEFWSDGFADSWFGTMTNATTEYFAEYSTESHSGDKAIQLINQQPLNKILSTDSYSIEANKSYRCSMYVKGKGRLSLKWYIPTDPNSDVNGFISTEIDEVNINTTDWIKITSDLSSSVNSDVFEMVLFYRLTGSIDDVEYNLIIDDVSCRYQ